MNVTIVFDGSWFWRIAFNRETIAIRGDKNESRDEVVQNSDGRAYQANVDSLNAKMYGEI